MKDLRTFTKSTVHTVAPATFFNFLFLPPTLYLAGFLTVRVTFVFLPFLRATFLDTALADLPSPAIQMQSAPFALPAKKTLAFTFLDYAFAALASFVGATATEPTATAIAIATAMDFFATLEILIVISSSTLFVNFLCFLLYSFMHNCQ